MILSGEPLPALITPDHPVRVYNYPDSFLTLIVLLPAPSFAPSTGITGATADVPPEEVVIMTGLQIVMSREFFGWPLYALVMAAGQVGLAPNTPASLNNNSVSLDAQCYQFPDYPLVRSKLAE